MLSNGDLILYNEIGDSGGNLSRSGGAPLTGWRV